jgi:ketosteroid isomerase-like protein
VTADLSVGDRSDAASTLQAEVLAAFQRYERALIEGDTAVLTESFLDSPRTHRFGIADQQNGAGELAVWRAAQPPLPDRRIYDTKVVLLGDEAAIVTTLFDYPGRPKLGRQSQAWRRTADGWRIVHAHVSEIDAPPG